MHPASHSEKAAHPASCRRKGSSRHSTPQFEEKTRTHRNTLYLLFLGIDKKNPLPSKKKRILLCLQSYHNNFNIQQIRYEIADTNFTVVKTKL